MSWAPLIRTFDVLASVVGRLEAPLARTWDLIKAGLLRVPGLERFLSWAITPVVRWDDLRTANHLTEVADIVRSRFPEQAAECEQTAARLRRRWSCAARHRR